LVADAVVDSFEFDLREELLERVGGEGFWAVAGQKYAAVGGLLDKCVGCVAVSADCGEADGAVRVGYGVRRGDGYCARRDSGRVYGVYVVDFEGDILEDG
jgi:hypothetical protein